MALTATIEDFRARLARQIKNAELNVATARSRIWTAQAHKGMLKSGGTLRLCATAIIDEADVLARAAIADIDVVHSADQSAAWEDLAVGTIQFGLRAPELCQLEKLDSGPAADRAFRELVKEGLDRITNMIRDAERGFPPTTGRR